MKRRSAIWRSATPVPWDGGWRPERGCPRRLPPGSSEMGARRPASSLPCSRALVAAAEPGRWLARFRPYARPSCACVRQARQGRRGQSIIATNGPEASPVGHPGSPSWPATGACWLPGTPASAGPGWRMRGSPGASTVSDVMPVRPRGFLGGPSSLTAVDGRVPLPGPPVGGERERETRREQGPETCLSSPEITGVRTSPPGRQRSGLPGPSKRTSLFHSHPNRPPWAISLVEERGGVGSTGPLLRHVEV